MDEFEIPQDWQPDVPNSEAEEDLHEAAIACGSPRFVIAKIILEAQAMMEKYRWN